MALRFLLISSLTASALGFAPTAPAKAIASTRLFSDVSSSTESSPGLLDRRDLLTASLGSVAVAAGWKLQSENVPTALVPESTTTQILSSVEDAVALIDAQCDRRFLHALVATDYEQLLYRGVAPKQAKYLSAVNTMDSGTSQAKPVATDFMESLESASLVEDFSGSTPFHLTTTGAKATAQKMSLWPLGANVHFCWTENEQDRLWSESKGSLVTSPQQIIVDGVNCGVMSLEDALERPQGQVMVRADSYLLVPASMEQDLIARLKDSFII